MGKHIDFCCQTLSCTRLRDVNYRVAKKTCLTVLRARNCSEQLDKRLRYKLLNLGRAFGSTYRSVVRIIRFVSFDCHCSYVILTTVLERLQCSCSLMNASSSVVGD